MSRRRLSPEDVIAAIYEEEGFYEVERSRDLGSTYSSRLILSDGKREIAVNVLDEESLLSRGALQDALLQAEKLKLKFDGVCIAVPRKYVKVIDESVMSMHGFGLIIYDKLGAEEIIPPRLRERESREPSQEPNEGVEKAEVESREIIELRKEVSRVLRILEEVEARLDRLERDQRSLAGRISRLESELARSKPVQRREEVEVKVQASPRSGRKLPSYLHDNPWVEILSRRE